MRMNIIYNLLYTIYIFVDTWCDEIDREYFILSSFCAFSVVIFYYLYTCVHVVHGALSDVWPILNAKRSSRFHCLVSRKSL